MEIDPVFQHSHLILGQGEIGRSLYNILKSVYSVWCDDVKPELKIMNNCPDRIDILHICIRFDGNPTFSQTVTEYALKYKPSVIDVCSTVLPGTCEKIQGIVNIPVCHSTTRGLHPNLEEGLKTIPKHIGGPASAQLVKVFQKAGIPCFSHARAKTTELLHILNNVHYGVNIALADEFQYLCRTYGVDYYDYMKYTETNNMGYMHMGMPTKVRTIVTPPNGKIGGHCVSMSANLISDRSHIPIIDLLANKK